MMDEHDNFRRIMDERAMLIADCRTNGAVDLETVRGAGFNSPERVARVVTPGHASGQYIGTPIDDFHYDRALKRGH